MKKLRPKWIETRKRDLERETNLEKKLSLKRTKRKENGTYKVSDPSPPVTLSLRGDPPGPISCAGGSRNFTISGVYW